MRTILIALASLAAAPLLAQAGPPPSQAQDIDARCAVADVRLQDACQKSVDAFLFTAPQVGLALAGGNPTLGQGGVLGGGFRFALVARVTAVEATGPALAGVAVATGGAQRSELGGNRRYLGLPAADLAVGILPPIGIGPVKILGLDALGSAAYLRDWDAASDRLAVRPAEKQYAFGYGARVGVLRETRGLPGISATYMIRELPAAGVTAVAGSGAARDTLTVTALGTTATSWRVMAGKRLGFLSLGGGWGRDRYESEARLAVLVRSGTCGAAGCRGDAFAVAQEIERENVFVNLGLSLKILRLVAEAGQQSGGDAAPTFNRFGGERPNATRRYASAGVRLGF